MEYFWIADCIGIFACAISGFLVGARKNLDLLGVVIASFATALGGGIVRDSFVATIPFAFKEIYPFMTVLIALCVAFAFKIHRIESLDRKIMFVIIDAIGLVAFSIAGTLVALHSDLNIFGIILLAFITGVGGGIIRDVMINEMPFVLVSEFYASVSILVAISLFLLDEFLLLNSIGIFLIAFGGVSLRVIAYVKKWHLPTIK